MAVASTRFNSSNKFPSATTTTPEPSSVAVDGSIEVSATEVFDPVVCDSLWPAVSTAFTSDLQLSTVSVVAVVGFVAMLSCTYVAVAVSIVGKVRW